MKCSHENLHFYGCKRRRKLPTGLFNAFVCNRCRWMLVQFTHNQSIPFEIAFLREHIINYKIEKGLTKE